MILFLTDIGATRPPKCSTWASLLPLACCPNSFFPLPSFSFSSLSQKRRKKSFRSEKKERNDSWKWVEGEGESQNRVWPLEIYGPEEHHPAPAHHSPRTQKGAIHWFQESEHIYYKYSIKNMVFCSWPPNCGSGTTQLWPEDRWKCSPSESRPPP